MRLDVTKNLTVDRFAAFASIFGLVVSLVGIGKLPMIIVIFISIFVLVCIFIIYWTKQKLQKELDSEKAAKFDYKFLAGIDSKSVNEILKNYEIQNITSQDGDVIKCFLSTDKRYIKCGDFFTGTDCKDFICKAVREQDKSRKCILQVSFIPVDADGNIPLIARLAKHHQSSVVLEDPMKFCFISFSPIPLKFDSAFSLLECYHREVPPRIHPDGFDELGFIIRKLKDGRVYLFYVFLAYYNNYHFNNDAGQLDMDTVKKLFAVDEAAEPPEFFVKDHDPVVAALHYDELFYAFCYTPPDGARDENVDNAREKVLKKIPEYSCDFSKALMPIEKRCLDEAFNKLQQHSADKN
ncbi:MAG: hypothetical protein IJS14_05795 [Lentisphaeria bacterium]|nr:hypothetical protein [Lentisphaeria bacterium]